MLGAADAAVAIARRLGDADALVAALAAAQDARWRPGPAEDRLAIIDELIELTEARGALVEAAEAHLCRAVASLELCALDEAEPHLARFGEIAERSSSTSSCSSASRCARCAPCSRATTRPARRQPPRCSSGAGARSRTAARRCRCCSSTYAIEMVALLNERDELGRLTPLVEQMVREIGALPGWRAALAWAHVQAAPPGAGTRRARGAQRGRFAAFPRDANFLPSLAMVAHAVGELGDAALAARAEPLLAPFRELWVVFGHRRGRRSDPSPTRSGSSSSCRTGADDAAETFELALERSMRMRARPYVARSRAGLAEALRRRAAPGDAARAEELSALAAADARELGMTRLA